MFWRDSIASVTHKRYFHNLSINSGKQNGALCPRCFTIKELKKISKKSKEKIKELPVKLTKDFIYFSTEEIEGELFYINKINFTKLFNSLPLIFSTNLYLNPCKKIKILLDGRSVFVVCKLQKPIEYISNMYKIKELIEPLNDIFFVDTDFVLVREADTNYLITRFNGRTLEDCIKEQRISPMQRGFIIRSLAELSKLFSNKKVIFSGFAPRNFLLSNKKICIIDFEELHYLKDYPLEKIKYTQDIQAIYFSDVFNMNEISEILHSKKKLNISKKMLIVPDSVETAYFRKSKITQGERDDLWLRTKKIEQAIARKDRIIYGHNLGQFFSDNFSPELEARILRQIYPISEQDPEAFKDSMLLLDFFIDFYNENKFRELYRKNINFDLLALVVAFLDKLDTDYENIITLIRFFDEMGYLDKNSSFIKRKNIVDLFVKNKAETINGDFSKIFLFDKYAFKTVYSVWRDEVKNIDIINRIFSYSPEKIKVYPFKDYSTIIYKNYGTSNLKQTDSANAAKLLAQLHNIKINIKISKKLKSKYTNFNAQTIKSVCEFLLKTGYSEKSVEMLYDKMLDTKNTLSSHPNSIVHNDLYYDQFHRNDEIRLDWTFVTTGSPFMDLSSILRDDYDNRNKKLNKKLFLEQYLRYSRFADNYSKKMMEEGFYMNCARDIIWFIERINLGQTHGGEAYTWLKDAIDDLVESRFEKFYRGLLQ